MTERFTLFNDNETIIDNESVAEDGGKQVYWTVSYNDVKKIVELLNALHEENIKCKEYNATIYANSMKNGREHLKQISQLKKENEHLKQQLASIDRLIDDLGSNEMCRQYEEIIGDVE